MEIDKALETVQNGDILTEKEFRELCERAKDILMEESNCQPVRAPVIVCGDIHGQFHDLLKLFDLGGKIPESSYVFMGDYVDRGYNSLETIQLLLCYKVKYPGNITLLRGNHETRQTSALYGFYEEANRKYGNPNPWKYCMEVFDHFPISAVIENKVFCVHGGLSPDVSTLDQIRMIDRKQEIPHEGAFCDMMWSDPDDIETWAYNVRGAGFVFGSKVTSQYLHNNGLSLVARAHQLVMEGYKFWFKEKNLVTVWSAPNYCYRCGNIASIMKVDEKLDTTFIKFERHEEQMQKAVNYKTVVPYFL